MARISREVESLQLERGTADTISENNHTAQAPARNRQALGDVSNNREASNQNGPKPLRRSRRLSGSGNHNNNNNATAAIAAPPGRLEARNASGTNIRTNKVAARPRRAYPAAVNPLVEPRPMHNNRRRQRHRQEADPLEPPTQRPRHLRPAADVRVGKAQEREGNDDAAAAEQHERLPDRRSRRSNNAPNRAEEDDVEKEVRERRPPRIPQEEINAINRNQLLPDIAENHRLRREAFIASNYVTGHSEFDNRFHKDPVRVVDYSTDIYQRLFNTENRLLTPPYMGSQPELNDVMRAILVDWLIEVHMKFRLLPETLYLCVNIIDRYLAREPVSRNRLQLVGVTALLVACKYEEIYPPELRDCVYITDRAFTRQEILDMEASMMKTLEFTLTVATGHPFLQRFLHIIDAPLMVRNLATYYMERTLQEHSALEVKGSQLAAAAVSLAQSHPERQEHDADVTGNIADSPAVPPNLVQYSGYSEEEIKQAAQYIVSAVAGGCARHRNLHAVNRKFESTLYQRVSVVYSPPRVEQLER